MKRHCHFTFIPLWNRLGNNGRVRLGTIGFRSRYCKVQVWLYVLDSRGAGQSSGLVLLKVGRVESGNVSWHGWADRREGSNIGDL